MEFKPRLNFENASPDAQSTPGFKGAYLWPSPRTITVDASQSGAYGCSSVY
jgi:hypothetical protein